ncbi:uncharacterized protein N7518_007085 [Penicillium psychrosexuale]|uniref:uncharacterized protein n=1 Tax=Penicillium psychrosexuale TaxID=1002107 RepID=UPI0025452A24|nr:uncharacterized protein N7518_007085 [Penicillium psychrosexuale]KAJ5790074.1 hypothetical protein N7518_007085 [Penicillium psychrosexuale]
MASITTQEVLRYPKLSVEVLPFPDVERIFHLTRAENTDWAQLRAPFELADHCKIVLKMVDAAISRSNGRPEMAVKLRLGILLDAVHATPPNPESPDSTPIPISSKCPFLFGPVVYNEKVHCLQGTPDWFLWYGPDGDKGKENVAINLVILEAEHGQSANGVRQTLAYMSK